jgi:hypothetical protein
MNKTLVLLLAMSGSLAAQTAPRPVDPDLRVVDLRCELAANPLGVDSPHPSLGWSLESGERGQRETAWQVLVASSPSLLDRDQGDLWDSGRVLSDATSAVAYAGAPLGSSQQVFWKVRVWDRAGQPTSWGAVSNWTMGILAASDWKGSWIAAPNATESLLLRREFLVGAGLRRAILHVCGLGQYEARIDGAKVGEDFLSPGWTDYDKTTLYDTHDVTALVREGRNAIGLFLGNGMYDVVRRDRYVKFTGFFGPLRAIAQLRLEYADGRTQFVGTDANWRTLAGPVVGGGEYGGEDYDARLLPQGWDRPGFSGRAWLPAVVCVGERHTLRGMSAAAEPLREIEVQRPLSSRAFSDGSVVYDLGQNAAHIPRIRVSGPAGSRVRLWPSELLNPDGAINVSSMGGSGNGDRYWQYTKSDDAAEEWTPHFCYIGCRYLRVEVLPPDTDVAPAGDEDSAPAVVGVDSSRLAHLDDLEGVVVHSSAAPVGRFETSSTLLNRIRTLVRWAQRSNMVSVLTDCPHREKLGWLEQYHLNGPSIRYEFDLDRLFAKGVRDMAEAQHADGLIPEIAPEYVKFNPPFNSAAEWGSAFILVPWQQYEFTGDSALLRDNYDAMKRYFGYLESKVAGGTLFEGLGDWYDLGPNRPGIAQLTAPPVTATAFYYYDAAILAEAGRILGRTDDAAHYAELAAKIRTSYNSQFFNPDSGSYASGSQCANALALEFGIARPADRSRVLAALVADVERHGNAITAGDVGFRFVLQALAHGGRSDIVYKMINQDGKPGYAYQLRHGATSLTEAWDANEYSSQDHFMLGQIVEWFYRDLAGIGADPAAPGFSKIVLRPQPVGDLTWVDASYASIRGPVSVRWERDGARFTLKASIPPNTTATLYLPAEKDAGVTEGGAPAEGRPGVAFLQREGDRNVYSIESGSYEFVSQWNN